MAMRQYISSSDLDPNVFSINHQNQIAVKDDTTKLDTTKLEESWQQALEHFRESLDIDNNFKLNSNFEEDLKKLSYEDLKSCFQLVRKELSTRHNAEKKII